MDIKTIIHFLKVCETESISAAARKIYISPQGLNRTIHNLETELGVTLFEKNAQGIALNEYGRRFEKFCQRVDEEYLRLIRDLSNIKEQKLNEISIGIAKGVFLSLGKEFFPLFQELHPEIQVIYEDGADLDLEDGLQQGKYSLIVGTLPFDSERFASIPLAYYDMYAWVHNDHPLSSRDALKIEDLEGQPIISLGKSFKFYHIFEKLCQEKGFAPTYAMISDDRFMALWLTSINQGILLALKRDDIFIHSFPVTSIPVSGVRMGYGVCYQKDHVLAPAENLMIQAIKDRLR